MAEQEEYMTYLQGMANKNRQEYDHMNLDIDAYLTVSRPQWNLVFCQLMINNSNCTH